LTCLVALVALAAEAQKAQEAQEVRWNSVGAGNPVLPGYFADPTVRKFGDMYYLYCTTDGTAGGLGPSQVWTSKDFVNWSIQPMNWPSTRQIWAPDVMQAPDGKYYFFYSQACKIYCAVSGSPVGPWQNIFGAEEAVLIPDRYVSMAITLDAQSFVDDDGSVYLYWGTWGIYPNHGCGVGKLNPDMKSFADTSLIPNTQAVDFFEAPFVFKRNGIYYFTYSSGSCHDHTYRVQYAVSKTSPMGPYEFADNNPILETNSDSTIHGPGHHSILREGDDYYIVYHRHNIPQSTRGFHRQVAADRLTFDAQGRINKVEAGHKGVGSLQRPQSEARNLLRNKGVKITASSWYNDYFKPEYAADDNNATLWRATGLPEAGQEEWLVADLGKKYTVKSVHTQFEHATSFYRYVYHTSRDGSNWTLFADRTDNTIAASPMIDVGNCEAQFIRLTFKGNEKNGFLPAVWNIKVFSDNDSDDYAANATATATGAAASLQNSAPKFNNQKETAAEKRRGLLLELNADNYEQGAFVGRIRNEANPSEGFDAVGMPAQIQTVDGRKAFAFNGRQRFVSDFGLPATMSGNPPYTIVATVASPAPRENECIIDLNDAWDELEKIIFGYGTSPRSGIMMHHGWYEDMGVAALPQGKQWNRIVVTFDGYKERLYINGLAVNEKDIFLNLKKSDRMTLGVKFDDEHPFSGYLHSLKIYDKIVEEEL